jgi:hypothetical protein
MVIDRLAKGGDPANRTEKGNNLHNVYLTRSYTCKVESLGNMMIQPLQYFDLTNIPMFYGTYIITKVEHNVKPHHITTNFTGVRQPIATVPIVEDVAVAINMKNITAVEGGNVLGGGSGGSGGSGGGVGLGVPLVDDSVIAKDIRDGIGTKVQSTETINIPASVEDYFLSTGRFKEQIPTVENQTSRGVVKRADTIKHMNEFLYDRWGGFATFLNNHYPQFKGKIVITSAIRNSIPGGSSSGSQHLRGEAVDFSFTGNVDSKLDNTHSLFNALLQYLRVNDFGWDQIFQPQGYDVTYSQMSIDQKNKVSMRRIAIEKLRSYLDNN